MDVVFQAILSKQAIFEYFPNAGRYEDPNFTFHVLGNWCISDTYHGRLNAAFFPLFLKLNYSTGM